MLGRNKSLGFYMRKYGDFMTLMAGMVRTSIRGMQIILHVIYNKNVDWFQYASTVSILDMQQYINRSRISDMLRP